MFRRGFTLLELLVVIGLVLALASVVVPVVVTRASGSNMPEAQLQVEAALMMARADAQRDASPVRVCARMGSDGGMELFTESVELGGSAREPGAGAAMPTGEASTTNSEDRTRLSAIYSLPKGISVCDSMKPNEPAAGTGSETVARPNLPDAASPVESMLLAVFLPSGEAIRPGPRYLVDDRGRMVELVLEPWSGRVSTRPVARQIEGAAPAPPTPPTPAATANVSEETGR